MKLVDLVGKQLCDGIVELREETDAYEEVVILGKDLPTWYELLSEKLGPPLISEEEYEIVNASEDVKSSNIELALESAEQFGGIAVGQTLYYGVHDSAVILILVWPWSDNVKVTLKKAIL